MITYTPNCTSTGQLFSKNVEYLKRYDFYFSYTPQWNTPTSTGTGWEMMFSIHAKSYKKAKKQIPKYIRKNMYLVKVDTPEDNFLFPI